MAREDDWETINIKHSRMNGIRLLSEREGRSMIRQLDWILRSAKVPNLDDAELERQRRSYKKEEEIPAAIRK